MLSNVGSSDLFPSTWPKGMTMEMFDRLPRDVREAIAYADANYSIEELFTDPNIILMSREKLLQFLWEHSDGFKIRYPHHVRVQYERARAASYRNRYVSDWPLGRDGMEVLYGLDPFGPLR